MKGKVLDPEFEEKITGQAIVRETCTLYLEQPAGSYVQEGVVKRLKLASFNP